MGLCLKKGDLDRRSLFFSLFLPFTFLLACKTDIMARVLAAILVDKVTLRMKGGITAG